jgi:hypothetical protein
MAILESQNTPFCGTVSCAGGSTYGGANLKNIATLSGIAGGTAQFLSLTNTSSTYDVQVKLNGSSSAIFTLVHETTQVFNPGDLVITSFDISNTASGATTVVVDYIMGVS